MKIIARLYLFFLRRRYKLSISGIELLDRECNNLIFPNHPAHIDAHLLGSLCVIHTNITPVVSEKYVNMPFVGMFLKRVKAIPVSDLKFGNRDPYVLEKIISGVEKALNAGRSPVIYPAGQIKFQAEDIIRNKQTAHYLVSDLPENVRVIGVRIKGLWGSSWSTYPTGKRPYFLPNFLKGIGIIFANLIFFCPKRKVSIEFVDITEKAIKEAKGSRKSFNTFLENFYHEKGIDPLVLRKKFFFVPEVSMPTADEKTTSS
jgi:long-chain-fatty-acid--[acyl-carrier-protein] ligase